MSMVTHDEVDGCVPSKAIVQEDMEVGQDPDMMGQQQQFNVSVSQELNSQPATQPLDGSFDLESPSQGLEEGVWGQLYPHCGTFPRIALRQESFRLGRATTCDYVIRESDMGTHRWLTAVSKCQCEILKTPQGVFLKDRSSNGTWVNGRKVGKDLMMPLDHNSEICFAGANKKVFIFISNDGQTDIFPSSLTNKYTVSKVLGKGATGEVRLGFRIPDLHRVAIKIICKKTNISISSKEATQVLNEVRILQTVSHPCVINLENVIDTPEYLFIVLELAEGGELFDKIIERTKFNEVEAKLHFYQIASAIKYLHAKNICHRDLKPENVLLCTVDDSNPIVKITDMGLSKLVNGTVLKTFCGTPQYIAPEVVTSNGLTDSSYTLKVDCWSLGVILYILLSGTPPFSEDRNCGLNLRAQILGANYVFYPELFNNISNQAKDLISKLLKVNPVERMSADDILKHPWLQDSSVIMRARALMATQLRGKKRLVEEVETDQESDKRLRVGDGVSVSVFKSPQLGEGGVFNPPIQN